MYVLNIIPAFKKENNFQHLHELNLKYISTLLNKTTTKYKDFYDNLKNDHSNIYYQIFFRGLKKKKEDNFDDTQYSIFNYKLDQNPSYKELTHSENTLLPLVQKIINQTKLDIILNILLGKSSDLFIKNRIINRNNTFIIDPIKQTLKFSSIFIKIIHKLIMLNLNKRLLDKVFKYMDNYLFSVDSYYNFLKPILIFNLSNENINLSKIASYIGYNDINCLLFKDVNNNFKIVSPVDFSLEYIIYTILEGFKNINPNMLTIFLSLDNMILLDISKYIENYKLFEDQSHIKNNFENKITKDIKTFDYSRTNINRFYQIVNIIDNKNKLTFSLSDITHIMYKLYNIYIDISNNVKNKKLIYTNVYIIYNDIEKIWVNELSIDMIVSFLKLLNILIKVKDFAALAILLAWKVLCFLYILISVIYYKELLICTYNIFNNYIDCKLTKKIENNKDLMFDIAFEKYNNLNCNFFLELKDIQSKHSAYLEYMKIYNNIYKNNNLLQETINHFNQKKNSFEFQHNIKLDLIFTFIGSLFSFITDHKL